MKVNGQFRYVGGESNISNTGKQYYLVSLLQGLDSSRIYVDQEMYHQAQSIPEFSEVNCVLQIDITAKGTYLHLDSIQLADKKVKEKPERKAV